LHNCYYLTWLSTGDGGRVRLHWIAHSAEVFVWFSGISTTVMCMYECAVRPFCPQRR